MVANGNKGSSQAVLTWEPLEEGASIIRPQIFFSALLILRSPGRLVQGANGTTTGTSVFPLVHRPLMWV